MLQNWSYSGSPSTSAKDAVRFYIGDTEPKQKQLTDGEIEFLLIESGSAIAAAVEGCITLAAKYSREFDEGTGKTSSSGKSSVAQHYLDLAKTLAHKRDNKPVVPYVGGQSIATKDTDRDDADLPQSAFRRDLHDGPKGSTLDRWGDKR